MTDLPAAAVTAVSDIISPTTQVISDSCTRLLIDKKSIIVRDTGDQNSHAVISNHRT